MNPGGGGAGAGAGRIHTSGCIQNVNFESSLQDSQFKRMMCMHPEMSIVNPPKDWNKSGLFTYDHGFGTMPNLKFFNNMIQLLN